ncbi:MAG: AAA family ATPase [Gammaproteobacteria bacterium]|nr:AAA family ATPase [Gammaproteobacteria bacterium]
MARHQLPLGTHTLQKIRNRGCYYVDKTPHIKRLIDAGDSYFLSRPRRFGKSLLLDTLQELFEGNEPLFTGLAIHNDWDWSVNYPVVRMSFDNGKYHETGGLDRNIAYQLKENEADSGLEPPPELCSGPERFSSLLRRLFHKTGQQVVVLIDEYDKPMLDVIDNKQLLDANHKDIRSLYSVIKNNDKYVRFVFVTGVSMFSKVSLFSELNSLTDISLNPEFATLCGFTDHDLDTVFPQELEGLDRDKVRQWYNGYNWLGEEKLYSPHDILHLFNERKFKAHWFKTASPNFLIQLLLQEGLSLMQLKNYVASEALITAFDIDCIDIKALLFQTGYLTITAEDSSGPETLYTLDYPNLEVRQSLNRGLFNFVTKNNAGVRQLADTLCDQLLSHDFNGFIKDLRSLYAGIPYQWQGKNSPARYEAWYISMLHVVFEANGLDVRVEDATQHGRSDLILLINSQVFLFEFKMIDNTDDIRKAELAAGKAIEQIVNTGYADKYRRRKEPIYAIGLVFDRGGKGQKPAAFKAIQV